MIAAEAHYEAKSHTRLLTTENIIWYWAAKHGHGKRQTDSSFCGYRARVRLSFLLGSVFFCDVKHTIPWRITNKPVSPPSSLQQKRVYLRLNYVCPLDCPRRSCPLTNIKDISPRRPHFVACHVYYKYCSDLCNRESPALMNPIGVCTLQKYPRTLCPEKSIGLLEERDISWTM